MFFQHWPVAPVRFLALKNLLSAVQRAPQPLQGHHKIIWVIHKTTYTEAVFLLAPGWDFWLFHSKSRDNSLHTCNNRSKRLFDVLLYPGDSRRTWTPYTSSVLWNWLQQSWASSLHLTPPAHHLPSSWKHVTRGARQHLQKAVEKIHPNPPWLAQRMEMGRRWFKQLYNSKAKWGDMEADGAGKHIWASNFCPASLTMVQNHKNLYSALPFQAYFAAAAT